MNDGSNLTPNQLIDFPELAALHILKAAASVARKALLARYPNLLDSYCRYRCTRLDACAIGIQRTISILEAELEHYFEAAEQLRQQLARKSKDRKL